jgi:sec-independent protein translocase protein TatA
MSDPDDTAAAPRGTLVLVNLGAPELLIILLVVLLLFGGTKLPKLARSLGEAKKEFEGGVKDGNKTPSEGETPS